MARDTTEKRNGVAISHRQWGCMVGHLPLRRWVGKTVGSWGKNLSPPGMSWPGLTGALAEVHGSKEKELTVNHEIQAGTWASSQLSPYTVPKRGGCRGQGAGKPHLGLVARTPRCMNTCTHTAVPLAEDGAIRLMQHFTPFGESLPSSHPSL